MTQASSASGDTVEMWSIIKELFESNEVRIQLNLSGFNIPNDRFSRPRDAIDAQNIVSAILVALYQLSNSSMDKNQSPVPSF